MSYQNGNKYYWSRYAAEKMGPFATAQEALKNAKAFIFGENAFDYPRKGILVVITKGKKRFNKRYLFAKGD